MLDALTILTIIAAWLTMGWLLITNHTTQRTNMKTVAELAAEQRAANAQTKKGLGEIKAKILRLQELIAAGADTTELEAAVNEAKAVAQEVDDQVPDAPAEPS